MIKIWWPPRTIDMQLIFDLLRHHEGTKPSESKVCRQQTLRCCCLQETYREAT